MNIQLFVGNSEKKLCVIVLKDGGCERQKCGYSGEKKRERGERQDARDRVEEPIGFFVVSPRARVRPALTNHNCRVRRVDVMKHGKETTGLAVEPFVPNYNEQQLSNNRVMKPRLLVSRVFLANVSKTVYLSKWHPNSITLGCDEFNGKL